jgi:hypothetical protein
VEVLHFFPAVSNDHTLAILSQTDGSADNRKVLEGFAISPNVKRKVILLGI